MGDSDAEDVDRLVQLASLALCYDFVDEAAAIMRRESVSSLLRRDGGLPVESMLATISHNLAGRYRKRRRRERWLDFKAAAQGMLGHR